MKNYRIVKTPCDSCNKWINNTELLECRIDCNAWENYLKTEKICWNCAYEIWGYGCVQNPDEVKQVEVDGVCDNWTGIPGKLICCCGMGNALRKKYIALSSNDKLCIEKQEIIYCPFCGEEIFNC